MAFCIHKQSPASWELNAEVLVLFGYGRIHHSWFFAAQNFSRSSEINRLLTGSFLLLIFNLFFYLQLQKKRRKLFSKKNFYEVLYYLQVFWFDKNSDKRTSRVNSRTVEIQQKYWSSVKCSKWESSTFISFTTNCHQFLFNCYFFLDSNWFLLVSDCIVQKTIHKITLWSFHIPWQCGVRQMHLRNNHFLCLTLEKYFLNFMTFLLTFFSETFSIENFCLCQYLLSKLVYFCVKHLKSAPKLKHGLDKKFVLIIITTQSSRSPFVCGTPTSLLNFHSLHMYIYKYISKVKVFSSYTPVSSLSNINHCR